MTWSEFLATLPFFRTRHALAVARQKLREAREELATLGQQVQAQKDRLDEAKRKRQRLERRVARAAASDQRPLLVFDHIPKTAGTTFRRSYMTRALAPEERWILSGGETNARDRQRFLSLPASERARLRIVAGHDAEALRPHLPAARFITVVRDPIERAISSYLHARFHPGGEQLWPDVTEKNLTLAQFAHQYLPPNLQSRTLLGEDHESLDHEQMRRRLASRYVLVGHTEAFDEFVFLLHATEGMPLCLYHNRLVRSERQAYVPPASDLDLLRQANAVDTRLHAVVQEAFRARVDGLSAALQSTMRRYLDELTAFRASARQGD